MSGRIVYLAVLTLTVSFMAGCAESKIGQCARLIQPLQQITLEAKSAAKKPQNIDIGFIKRGLSIADRAATNISAIELQDPKLKEYQSALVDLYRTNSQGTQAFLNAFAKKDRIKAGQALDSWKQQGFSDRERQLIADINSYCFGRQ